VIRMNFQSSLALLVICAAFIGDSAVALESATVAAIQRNAEALVALAGDTTKNGEVPRLINPSAKPLIESVFDTTELQRAPRPSALDLLLLNNWALSVNKAGMIYVLAGTGVANGQPLPMGDPKFNERVNRNTVTYAPEIGRYTDAAVWLQCLTGEAAMSAISQAPKPLAENIKSGFAMIQSGEFQSLYGVITTLEVGVTDAWRRDRLAVLSATAMRTAESLAKDDLRKLSEHAKSVAAKIRIASVFAAP
jgi:hypothetical protein